MQNYVFRKSLVIGIIILFVGASVLPVSGITNDINDNFLVQNTSNPIWIERQKIVASDGEADDIFGRSVSINDEYAVIGANNDDDNGKDSGSAYVFKRDGINWIEQAKLLASDGEPKDSFGGANSISDDYIIIGAIDYYNGGNGSAYIFKRNQTGWYEQAILTASDGSVDDWFGVSVSISGDYALVGALHNDVYGDNSGSAYIFKRDGTNWIEEAILHASDYDIDDYFGCSVSLDGDYALIGAFGADSAYVFKRDGANWNEQAILTASDGKVGDYFGYSVSLDGEYTIIGAPNHDNDIGAAYIFKHTGSSWTEEQKLTPAEGEDDLFGAKVTISNDHALVGAPLFYGEQGCAYVFKRSGASWTEEQRLTASDGSSYNYFGAHSTINGNKILIGSYINNRQGAAYFFEKLNPNAPNAPIIKGPAKGKVDNKIEYTFNAEDPNGDDIKYHIYWDDGDSDVTGLNPSGTDVKVKHTWNNKGTYTIRAYAEDEYGLVGPEGTLTVTMPRSRAINGFFLRFLEQFPLLQLLLQR